MKRLLFLSLLSFILGWLNLNAQYQVNCIDTNGETMTFRVVGYGKNAKIASHNAELSVIKALMFEGIPNSQQHIAMVKETETEALNKYGNSLSRFLDGEYQSEITRSVVVRKFGKDINKQKSITLDVTVNIRALRSKLERLGIIRKFGL
ncbi:MAG: hypothetical protein K2G90_02855 [Muribaculaceae bacterium]|nr:hypothetical protein [Muribaculaceae bacterium]MDE6008126.1 hypothetical protein [Muribaculaceae bacterium]